jgi:hypothetical protein
MIARAPSALTRLRRNRDAVVLAALALFMQLVAITAHLAMEATDFGGARFEVETVGLLVLCHESEEVLPSGDPAAPHHVPAPCMICQTAQIAGTGVLPILTILADPAPRADLPTVVPRRLVGAPSFVRFGVNRGPPSLSHA